MTSNKHHKSLSSASKTHIETAAKLFARPRGLALFAEGLEAFLGVFRHRQQRDLAFGIGDAFVERHRGDRPHGVFAAPDRGRRLVDDAADQPIDLGVELGRRHHVVQESGSLRRVRIERFAGQRPFADQPLWRALFWAYRRSLPPTTHL